MNGESLWRSSLEDEACADGILDDEDGVDVDGVLVESLVRVLALCFDIPGDSFELYGGSAFVQERQRTISSRTTLLEPVSSSRSPG